MSIQTETDWVRYATTVCKHVAQELTPLATQKLPHDPPCPCLECAGIHRARAAVARLLQAADKMDNRG